MKAVMKYPGSKWSLANWIISGNSKYAKEYLAIADLMAMHFDPEKKRV